MTDNTQGTRPVSWSHSDSLPGVLSAAACSLLVSTYQAGQLAAVGVADGALSLSFRHFQQAMGIGVGPTSIAVGANEQIWELRPFSDIAPQIPPAGSHDACYLPRTSVFTGDLQGHELAWGQDADGEPELWLVNTGFSCLAGVDEDYNFTPRWRPPFITDLAAEDRCHLNGLAMREGRPAFVTMMAATNEARGWRKLPKSSGLVLDVATGRPVIQGLTMPHSPRWYDGQLYVLNSGLGQLLRVDARAGAADVVAAMPGYTRGLAIHDGFAFVGLSRIRETAVFGEIPLAEFHDRLVCGIGVVDLASGDTIATLMFTSTVEEIFDVQVLPGVRSPALSAPGGDEIWVTDAPRHA